MKRFLILLVAVCLLLGACGAAPVETTPVTTTEPTVETTTEPTTEPTTIPTEPPVLYRHPLTGEPLEEVFKGRPVTVSIGNTKAALPQMGISKADVFYEIEAEGGITRFLPVFTEYKDISRIGPVRSARTFFNNVSVSYDAVIAHCGGSVRGINGYYDLTGSKISGWDHVDQFANGSYFYRDKERKQQGYALEHRLFTTGEMLLEVMTKKEYLSDEVLDYGYQFAEDEDLVLTGETANEITVHFLGKKTSTLTYNEETGLYAIEQYDRKLIDGDTDEQLTFKNVIVIYAPQTKKSDGYYKRSYYEIIGEGTGYFAVNGKITKIKWSRPELEEPFSYTLEDGTPVTLGVGKMYVGISSDKSTEIEYK